MVSSSSDVPPEPALRRADRSGSAAELSAPPPAVAHGRVGSDPLAPLLDLAGVAAAVASARDSVDRLLGHRVLRRQSAAVTAEAALRGARASAALEGVPASLAELRTAAASADPVVRGALRISAGLGGLVDTWPRAPRQVLARLHLLAAAGTAEAAALGRPAGAAETSARLAGLATLVAGGTAVPAVVLAAVVHGELRVLSPFGWGDGLVARAAARLTMISSGLDPKSVSVPEVGHWELRADYDAALAGYATGTEPGLTVWLHHCCAAVELGAREGLAICEAILRR